ncbi:ABC transporter ATP-binding protein [Nocardiopsis protaetiae]|uniref:ABC transporter ATP-binding protein n=1 Tax=Nocardiopsis protaetiae TaxID=3382270 RepID=UPI00387B04BD
MIRFDQVTKAYPDGTVAVDGLDLTAPTGKTTVLVGPSGCGKTTSLRMVNRLIEPSSGTVLLDGRDTAGLDTAELRRGIGYVIQNAGLFPHRTVADNIASVPRLLGWNRRKARGRALELLELVGLPLSYADRYPAQLSGGQQQRVGVARALAADPPVMLMDEPFSAVDPVVRARLQEEFLALQREIGKTILFVTHDIAEAVTLGDRIAVLRVGGRLAQFAPPHELLTRPVDDFVADFVGRDRGYRALDFAAPAALEARPENTVRLGAPLEEARGAARDGWALVVSDAHRPLGWVDVTATGPGAAGSDPVRREHLVLGGTTACGSGGLRELLDAALSSPSGRGAVTDDAGTLTGTVTPEDVVRAITAARAEAAARASVAPAGATAEQAGPAVGGPAEAAAREPGGTAADRRTDAPAEETA